MTLTSAHVCTYIQLSRQRCGIALRSDRRLAGISRDLEQESKL